MERCQTCSTVTVTDLGGARFVCVKEEVWQSFSRPAWLEQLAFCKNQQNFLLQGLEAFPGNFAPVKISCYTVSLYLCTGVHKKFYRVTCSAVLSNIARVVLK